MSHKILKFVTLLYLFNVTSSNKAHRFQWSNTFSLIQIREYIFKSILAYPVSFAWKQIKQINLKSNVF